MTTKAHPYALETRDLIRRLAAAGWPVVAVDNGEELTVTDDPAKQLEEATACDEAHLYFQHPQGSTRRPCANGIPGKTLWVYIVLGNSPGELASDYTFPNDEEAAAEVDALFTAFSDAWEHGGAEFFAARCEELEARLAEGVAAIEEYPLLQSHGVSLRINKWLETAKK